MQTIFIVWTAKLIKLISRIIGKGGGTALPGLVAENLSPNILKKLTSNIETVILITGTNGKTTTQTILGSILKEAGVEYIANKSGSNLKRGIISLLISKANLWGRVKAEYAIFEVEEATLPKIISDLNPSQLIVTNLYRDQLDAYGEIDRTQKFIKNSITQVKGLDLIINADDPRVSELADNNNHKTTLYGIDPNLAKQFNYEGKKDLVDEKEAVRAVNIVINEDLTSSFNVKETNYNLKAPGIFHIYNGVAAITSATLLGIGNKIIQKGVEQSNAAFGRGEDIDKDGITYKTLLIKNPAGFTLTLNLLKNIKESTIVLILNDNIADGRDVSWIWDSDVEILKKISPKRIICSGTRAEDMLLRVKYALGGLEKVSKNKYKNIELNTEVELVRDIKNIHKKLSTINSQLSTIYVLPTYTAMLAFRKNLLGKALDE